MGGIACEKPGTAKKIEKYLKEKKPKSIEACIETIGSDKKGNMVLEASEGEEIHYFTIGSEKDQYKISDQYKPDIGEVIIVQDKTITYNPTKTRQQREKLQKTRDGIRYRLHD